MDFRKRDEFAWIPPKPMPPPAADYVRDLLTRADDGRLPFVVGEPWRYCGNPSFIIGDVEVVVFDDCSEWDYIERVIFSTGQTYDFDEMRPYRMRHFSPEGLLAKSYCTQQTAAAFRQR